MLTSYQSHIAVVRPYQSNLNEPNTLTQLRCVRLSIIQLKNKRVLNKTQSDLANVFYDSTSERLVRFYTCVSSAVCL